MCIFQWNRCSILGNAFAMLVSLAIKRIICPFLRYVNPAKDIDFMLVSSVNARCPFLVPLISEGLRQS
jgi:hypothetical protein